MKINVRREVFIDVDVSLSTEDIAIAIAEAMEKEPSRIHAIELLTMCWQTLQGFTSEQIRLCGPSAKSHVVSALRTLADRFENG